MILANIFRKRVPIAAVLMAAMMLSCGHGQQNELKQTMADSLIDAAFDARDYERVLTLCDSLEQRGDISLFKAALERGYAYQYLSKKKLEVKVLKEVLTATPTNAKDSSDYFSCVAKLVDALSYDENYEEALQIAIPILEDMKRLDQEKPSEDLDQRLMMLMSEVGFIQVSLGMKDEGNKTLEAGYAYAKRPASDKRKRIRFMVQLFNRAVKLFITNFDNVTAEKWLARSDSMLVILVEGKDMLPVDSDFIDVMKARNYMNHAFLGANLDRPEEVSRAIENYKTTKDYSKSLSGHIDLATLLLYQKNYAEAADEYVVLDQLVGKEDLYRHLFIYAQKFAANYKAGRRDTALAVAAYVFEHLDSAIAKQNNSDAAELATVYETQQKDAEIAQQQISLSRQRWIGTLVALVLLTTFFIIYTLYRRRAQKRLATAHEKLEVAHAELKSAYDQLEETTAAKERIESELRIARDIQMSMVPGIFPEYEGLDMYASMTPAKEVGGDLYGYLIEGSLLYFCLGDVSGKGVPASLFMSQSARLFRTLATEGLSPVDIAVRMNNELAENNDRGMFVTMFIGLLHLDTGRLDFCNCGHNAPVIDGQFLKMQYDNQPLGLWEDDPFEGEHIDDIRGKQLLIYTDGLNEAENGQKELLGNKRLLELMADTQSLDSRQVIDKLKKAVEQHRNGAEPNDDLTLMCIRFERV
jgi:serine phosphatase RsbU (regulator of sigma subunit)